MKRNSIIITILIIALILGGGIAFYFNFETNNYLDTEDARIAADMLPITSLITGSISSWDVKEGDMVTQNQVVGKQDTTIFTTNNPSAASAPNILDTMSQIKSPIAGKIIHSTAIKNQMATQGTTLAYVANTGNAYISANIKETNIQNVVIGQRVDIKIDAYPNTTFLGAISSVGQATNSTFSLLPAQNTTGNYTKVTQLIPIKITLNDLRGANLLPGMNASIRIYLR